MIEVKVTLCKPNGEVLDTFTALAKDKDYSFASFPPNMVGQVIRELIEESFDTKDDS